MKNLDDQNPRLTSHPNDARPSDDRWDGAHCASGIGIILAHYPPMTDGSSGKITTASRESGPFIKDTFFVIMIAHDLGDSSFNVVSR